MSDIVERAQAAIAVLEGHADKTAYDAFGAISLVMDLLDAASCLPALIAEVTELRTELKWVNA